MKIIREPKDIDFTVDGRELTLEEQQKISAYIQHQKTISTKKSKHLPTQQNNKCLV